MTRRSWDRQVYAPRGSAAIEPREAFGHSGWVNPKGCQRVAGGHRGSGGRRPPGNSAEDVRTPAGGARLVTAEPTRSGQAVACPGRLWHPSGVRGHPTRFPGGRFPLGPERPPATFCQPSGLVVTLGLGKMGGRVHPKRSSLTTENAENPKRNRRLTERTRSSFPSSVPCVLCALCGCPSAVFGFMRRSPPAWPPPPRSTPRSAASASACSARWPGCGIRRLAPR